MSSISTPSRGRGCRGVVHRDVEAHAPVEGVKVRLAVLLEVSDVLPVALDDMAVEGPAHLEKEREELLEKS